ncbi:MAG: hypothetical protein WDN01_16735 [Rhizomicrobium sp.]
MATEFILLKLCALSLAILWLLAIWRGLREIGAGLRRLARGDGFGFDPWLLAPFAVAMILLGSWLASLYWLPHGFVATFDPADILGDADLLFLDIFIVVRDSATWIWGPALLLLIAIPIVHAFRNPDFYWHLYVVGVLGILAMPFALVAFGTFLERETVPFQRGNPNWIADPASAYGEFGRYGLRHVTPHCTETMMGALHLKTFDAASYAPERDRAQQLAQLWLNDTFNAMTLDIPAAFGCQLSQIEPNPNYFPMALTLAFYRAFVSLVMLGMVLRPFVRV